MTDVQLSIGAGEITMAVVSIAGSYIAWSARRVLVGLEQSIERLAKVCEEQEHRLDKHEHCLTIMCTNHELNHGQKINCKLVE